MNDSRHTVQIPPRLNGVRLDKAIADLMTLPRGKVSRLWKEGLISAEHGRAVKPAQAAQVGEKFIIDIPAPVPVVINQENINQLSILHEDDHIMVINKPAGLVVHPTHSTGSEPTLADLLHHARPSIKDARYSDSENDRARAGIVHRLDKDTSGVMIVAKTAEALQKLKEQFQQRTIKKEYQAVVWGEPKSQLIDEPIGRHPRRWWLRAVVPSGKESQTDVQVLKSGLLYRQPAALVSAKPRTGRTHQIRVHLNFLGTPILGDNRYSNDRSRELTRLAGIPRLMLHAAKISLTHPITNKSLSFEAPLPLDIKTVVNEIRDTV